MGGAIAELGAFAALDSVREKTLAIVNDDHPKPSFISDGPVRRLNFCNQSLVQRYTWDRQAGVNDEGNLEVFGVLAADLSSFLQKRHNDSPKEQRFRLDSHAHVMLAIADLIDIVGISTRGEIGECLEALGKELSGKDLHKYLFLLEHLRIIRKIEQNQTYYLTRELGPFMRYDFKPEAAVRDRTRAKVFVRDKLKSVDPRRSMVFKNAMKRIRHKSEGIHV